MAVQVIGGTPISVVKVEGLGFETLSLKSVRDVTTQARDEAQTYLSDAEDAAQRAEQYATQTASNQGPDNNPIAAGLEYAIQLAGQASRQVFELRSTILAQRTVFLKNKFVIQGFQLTKTDSRDLDLSETGTVGGGLSAAKIDGTYATFSDQADALAVPTNSSADPVTKYAYLHHDGSAYTLGIADSVPDKALLLYRLDIPAGDTANDLSNVTLVDERVVQPGNAWVSSFRPTEVIGFPYNLPEVDYGVACDVLDATNVAAVGELIVFDRTTNGAKIKMTGTADNVRVRVTLLNPNYQ